MRSTKSLIETIAHRYEGHWRQGYVRGKLRSDPVYAAVWELLKDSALPVLDVGCGMGLLEFYLREHGFRPPVVGLDFDATKITQAQSIAGRAYSDLTFTLGDVLSTGGWRGNVVLIDVLHYLPIARHTPLLDHLASLVAPGGLCIIRATPRDESWRFLATQFEEFFLRASLWMKSGAIDYPSMEGILAPFRGRGFACEVRPLWGRTPFNSHLFVFRAPRAADGIDAQA